MNIAATPVLSDSQVLGIDVSKAWFDVFLHPAAIKERFDNNAAGFRKLVRWLKSATVEIIVMEATGGLEAPLFNALQSAEYSVARINPRWIRDFAKATGHSAKTDQQDARGPPPLKWSAVMFRKRRIENGKQTTEAGRDCLKVAWTCPENVEGTN